MEWITGHWKEILLIAGVIERIAKETPEDFTFFGLPIGKYDNQISDFIGYIIKSVIPFGNKK